MNPKRSAIAVLAVVGALALGGGLWATCTASQGKESTEALKVGSSLVPIPGIPLALQLYLGGVSDRLDALVAENTRLAAEATKKFEAEHPGEVAPVVPEPKMSGQQWFNVVLGSLGAVAASILSSHGLAKKGLASMNAERDQSWADTIKAVAAAKAGKMGTAYALVDRAEPNPVIAATVKENLLPLIDVVPAPQKPWEKTE